MLPPFREGDNRSPRLELLRDGFSMGSAHHFHFPSLCPLFAIFDAVGKQAFRFCAFVRQLLRLPGGRSLTFGLVSLLMLIAFLLTLVFFHLKPMPTFCKKHVYLLPITLTAFVKPSPLGSPFSVRNCFIRFNNALGTAKSPMAVPPPFVPVPLPSFLTQALMKQGCGPL